MCITSTENDRIMNTLDVVPHNYPMSQISFTTRLLVAAQEITGHDVTFIKIGEDTITALTTLAEIFKNKFQKPL
jgi:hypothetical protein